MDDAFLDATKMMFRPVLFALAGLSKLGDLASFVDEVHHFRLVPFALANLVALAFGYNAGEDTVSPGSNVTGSIIAAAVPPVMPHVAKPVAMRIAASRGVIGPT